MPVPVGLPSSLSPDAQAALAELMQEDPAKVEERFNQLHYRSGKPPVGPEEFFDDPYYVGDWGKTLYPVWKEDLFYVLDPEKRIEEWGLVGGQGTGKTTAAEAAQLYKLYRLSRLRKPQAFYDLDNVSKIHLGLFSLNKEKSQLVLYEKFLAILLQSPYFREHFPSKQKRKTLRVAPTLDEITETGDAMQLELFFPEGIRMVSGSMTSDAISIDLASAIIDELNWRRKKTIRPEEDPNSALNLYEQLRTRIRGRFGQGHRTSAGVLCAISSKRATTDFMDGLVERMRQEPQRCHVSDYAIWEAKPGNWSTERFYVFIGGSYGQSRILKDGEEKDFDLAAKNVIAVPMNLLPDFEMNVNTGLRDHAGISTSPHQLLFDRPSQITAAENPRRQHPFTMDTVELGLTSPYTLDAFFDDSRVIRFDGVSRKPAAFPGQPRYIHFDLSKNRDATGMVCLCPAEVKRITSETPDGKKVVSQMPILYVDFALQIRAPAGDQVDYDKLRQFVIYLRRIGYPVRHISFDQYQSVGTMQLLAKQGFKTSPVSVDRTDHPYLALQAAFVQKRLNLYHYPPLYHELRQLVHDQERGKVDHPDVSDQGGPGCFTGDTKVRLLDGRSLSFEELVREFGNGREFHVYTVNEGNVSVGTARLPRMTRRNVLLVRVAVDSGESVRCTPDHLFMLRNGSYRRADSLEAGDSLMPLYTRISSRQELKGYEMYLDLQTGGWHYTHRMVGRWKYPGKGYAGNQNGNGIIHHDRGKLNNSPDALVWCESNAEHIRLYHKKDIMERRSDPAFEEKRLRGLAKYNADPETRRAQGERLRRTLSDPEIAGRKNRASSKTGKITGPRNLVKYNKSEKHRQVASEIGKRTIHHAIEAIRRRDVDIETLIKLRLEGKTNLEIASRLECSISLIEKRFTQARREGRDVPKGKNHEVVSVTPAGRGDVYDLTVDTTHNFALGIGVFVHNSKDVADALCGAYWAVMTAMGTVKKSKAVPTTLNVAHLDRQESNNIGLLAKDLFESLRADSNPDQIATVDWQVKNKVEQVDTTTVKKQRSAPRRRTKKMPR